ncbi:MAG: penicillin-binding protein 2 [Methylobacillus sp.]|jgi:cell division protein FtsI (penicillin-binding protein 3)|nr:penicillin-binding protein 2 [Methylobacillus sp.]
MNRVNRLPIRFPAWRRRVLLLGVLGGFVVLLGRSIYLQAMHTAFLQQEGDARYNRTLTLPAHRGAITDRNGEQLASSTEVESIWASPQDVEIDSDKLKQLAALLDMKSADLQNKLDKEDKTFVYLRRRMSPADADKVGALHIPGIYKQREYRRYYPAAEVTAHVVGFTGIEDAGQEGMELMFQNWLSGKSGVRHVRKDRSGHIIEDLEAPKMPQDGHDLALSIDLNIQYLAHRELKNAVAAHKAKAGAIVVLDAKTGEVLAMANQPTYNPNNPANIAGKSRNRAVVDIFEPGSTLKPFTIAAALQSGLATPDTQIETAPGSLRIGSATIHDTHPEGRLTLTQVIQKSSNVGAAKLALGMSPQYMWTTFNQVGFGSPASIGFPGEASGKLRPYKNWRPIEQATMAFGHGISLSLLQLARAYTVFADDGEIKPVTLLKLKEPPIGQRVFSTETARNVRAMLETVTQPGGTAPRAQVMGYRVAGKTGTAHKSDVGGYAANRYVSSFVGMAPASNPRLIIAVMIDEPGDGQYYGGTVAAPVFSAVMSGALRQLGVPQDAPNNNIVIPAGASEVGEMT